jgi:hypothetical protein
LLKVALNTKIKIQTRITTYYNAVDNRVRAFSLFCVSPAATGGVYQRVDPQMVYLLFREKKGDVVKALALRVAHIKLSAWFINQKNSSR